MAENIVIFEDGKLGRGSKARKIKTGNKRVLIEFYKYDYTLKEDLLITEWFTLFVPSWSEYKKHYKRKVKMYCHSGSNEFYQASEQTEVCMEMNRNARV